MSERALLTDDAPPDWTKFQLGSLFSFKNGINKAKRFFGAGTPIVNYMDVYRHPGLRLANLAGRVTVTEVELSSYEVRRGDVFFTRTSETVAEVGIAAVMLDDAPNTVFSGFVLRARPLNDRLDDEFKKYCFSSDVVRKQIKARSSYTTRALTNGRALSSVAVAIPPLWEQHAIGSALSDADALIDGLDSLISKKFAVREAVGQSLLSARSRLPGYHAVWLETQLKDLGTTYGGLAGKRSEDFGVGSARYVPFLNIMQNVVVDTSRLERVRLSDREKQNRIRRGDLLLNGSSETPEEVGMCSAFLNDADELFLNSFCFGFRLHDGSEADPLYLAYYLRSGEGRRLVYALAQGATRYNLAKTQWLKLRFPLPQYREQLAIAAVLSDLDKEISALQEQRLKSAQVKQGMGQALLGGGVRLSPSDNQNQKREPTQ